MERRGWSRTSGRNYPDPKGFFRPLKPHGPAKSNPGNLNFRKVLGVPLSRLESHNPEQDILSPLPPTSPVTPLGPKRESTKCYRVSCFRVI